MTAAPAPRVVRTRAALAEALAEAHGAVPGTAARRAVVMTMGALHEGHLALVRAARERADQVVVTIFVNPLQFGPTEDLARYPRDLEGDLALLSSAGADLVFAPTVDEVYPGGDPVVTVSAGRLGAVLEGDHRPGHFDGVLTVVLKLLHLVRPDVALFGQKDAQQLMAVRRMVHDLDVGVEVVAVPTVRDADGLALSSRNAYLGTAERASALALSRALAAGRRAADAGLDPRAVRDAAADVLAAEPGVVVDYVALVDPRTAADLAGGTGPGTADEGSARGGAGAGPALLAVAARVGMTRLIDNVVVDLRGVTGAAPPTTADDDEEDL